jgi:hypothetical protein
MLKKVRSPVGDFHDWNAITSWATAIGDALHEAGLTTDTQSEQQIQWLEGNHNESNGSL